MAVNLEIIKKRAKQPLTQSDVLSLSYSLCERIITRHYEVGTDTDDMNLTHEEVNTLLLIQIYLELKKLGERIDEGCD